MQSTGAEALYQKFNAEQFANKQLVADELRNAIYHLVSQLEDEIAGRQLGLNRGAVWAMLGTQTAILQVVMARLIDSEKARCTEGEP